MSSEANSRTRILDAALEQLLQDGSLNLSAVAHRARLSRQALYLHFESRSDLAINLARYTDDRFGLIDALRPLERAAGAEPMLRAYASFLARYNPRIRPVVRIARALRYQDSAFEAAWLDRVKNRRRATFRMARRLKDWGRLAPECSVRTAGDWLAAQGSVDLWEELVIDMRWSPERFTQYMATAFCRTLLIPAPDSP